MAIYNFKNLEYNIFVVECPPGYKIATESSANMCLESFCPIEYEMELDECITKCTRMKQCYLFNHVNVGKKQQCFLYGYDEGQGRSLDTHCGIKLGNTCCEKGK